MQLTLVALSQSLLFNFHFCLEYESGEHVTVNYSSF